MSSFLDELKSKHNAVIREEQTENDVLARVLACKEEIFDEIIQWEAKAALEKIKDRLNREFSKNPTDRYVEVRFYGPSYLCDVNLQGIRKVFCKCGFDLDDRSLEKVVDKIAIVGGISYNSEEEKYHAYGSFVPIVKERNGFMEKHYYVTEYGRKFVDLLKSYADLEGISITYQPGYIDFDHNNPRITKHQKRVYESNRKRGTFILASVNMD